VELEPGETLDALAGELKIFQLGGGHRYSTDDLLVAWYGTTWAPRVERALDLGSGIGSVAMLAAWRLPAARFVTIEAQERSLRLARKSVAYNGLEERFTLLHGDLREAPRLVANEPPFDLVLGSPPYWPPGTATPAEDEQAIAARIEMRGDLADYARAAALALAPGALFACVHPASRAGEAALSLAAAGLTIVRARDVVFREGEPPRVRLWACVRREDAPEDLATLEEAPLVTRLANGARSAEYAAIRLTMGFPPG
jgi:tRNA1(Val) A37 N6-methylase TrmN6